MNGVTGNVGVCVILPNKPGEYRTEPVGELTPIETWDYFYCGRHLATFVVATLHGAARIRVIDETESPNPVTVMPVRFLEKFRDRDAAVASLDTLAGPGRPETELRRRSPSPANR
jgi:hypothetical protein